MQRAVHFFAYFLIFLHTSLFGQDIKGYWKSISDETGKPQCVVAVYEYEGYCYGKILGTFDSEGKMDDDIYNPKGRAEGVVGQPFYAGLDIIWNLEPKGPVYKGNIVDPQKGKVYGAELWRKEQNLIVRGKLLFFGRNQTWLPASDADFPKGFKKPPLSSLVPRIPEVK